MSNAELIERLQIDASAVSAFHMYTVQNDCIAAADALALADKRIAELEQVNCSRLDEAERKLAVAREALEELCDWDGDLVLKDYCTDVLAQIGGEDAS